MRVSDEKMTPETAVKILREHNTWRRFGADWQDGKPPKMTDPKAIGIAIETACAAIEDLQEALTVAKNVANGNVDAKFAAWKELDAVVQENERLRARTNAELGADHFAATGKPIGGNDESTKRIDER